MKKIMLLLLFVPMIGFCQLILPAEARDAKMVNNINIDQTEVWLNILDKMKKIKFEQNPIGVKHSFEVLKPLLSLNNASEKPTLDESFYASYAKDLKNYETINLSVMSGDAEIKMSWLVNDKNIILFNLSKNGYFIIVQ